LKSQAIFFLCYDIETLLKPTLSPSVYGFIRLACWPPPLSESIIILLMSRSVRVSQRIRWLREGGDRESLLLRE